ncbi:hypothetical protein EL22_23190 [Halostagnicola sp. A56]|uniref:DUF7519 family protein n=1 Tax=Halostagnicola sp. A56 TaxID=1495067 RepID=UPI0004A15E8D|nr:hypothetical protein [Halostagnicola sp. A56]KDE59320.1 hypothetical protein EL22_23190 [Halostagnicola sp. A56]
MSDVTRRPTSVSRTVAFGGAMVAVLAATVGSIYGFGIGVVGLAVLALGLARGNRDAIDVGSLAIFAGVVAGGLQGESVELTVLATIGTVLAWDLGHDATDLGEQLGREAETARLEAVHVLSSLLIGLVAATLGYGVYVFAAGGQPIAAVVLFVLAGAALVVALGSGRDSGGWTGNANSRRR